MNKQKRFLTTGQLAKIHQINTRTLHYYDQVGLFSPKIKGDNGYRYYSMEQIGDLEVILAFRELGMSIEELKLIISWDAESANQLITGKIAEIDQRIESLKDMRKLLLARQKLAALSRSSRIGGIQEVECPEESFVLSSPLEGISEDDQFLVLSELLRSEGRHRLFNNNYGTMMCIDKIYRGVYDSYDYFYILPHQKKGKKLFKRPAGSYLQMICKGDWNLLPEAYKKLQTYAREHGLKLLGYSYERGLNETLSTNMEEYVTEILVRFSPAIRS